MSYRDLHPMDDTDIERVSRLQEKRAPLFDCDLDGPYYLEHKVNIPRPLVPNYGLPGKGTYKVVYTYPVGKPHMKAHTLTEPGHLILCFGSSRPPETRRRGELRAQAYNNPSLKSLIEKIESDYQTIYEIEDNEANPNDYIPTSPGMINRGKSFGPFGIWGHVLGDLVLEGLEIFDDPEKKDEYWVILHIGS